MPKKTTILQINHGYSAPFGDLAIQYGAIFDQNAHRIVQVFLTGAPDDDIVEQICADEVIFLDLKSKQLSGLKLAVLYKVFRIIRKQQPCLILAQRYKSIYVALIASMFGKTIPVLGIAHAFGVMSKRRCPLMNFFRHRLTLLGVSKAVTNDMLENLGPSWKNRVLPLLNCIDAESVCAQQLNRSAARKALNLPEQAYIFGNVGRIHPDKNPLLLINAFANIAEQHPDTYLVLIGSGKLETQVAQRVAELNLQARVFLLGQVAQAVRYFKAFNCYVSTATKEPFGIVLIEAMAAELAIISADTGGAYEVTQGVGHLYKEGNQQQLAETMLTVYQQTLSPDYKNSAALDKLFQHYSLQSFKKRFIALPLPADYPHLQFNK